MVRSRVGLALGVAGPWRGHLVGGYSEQLSPTTNTHQPGKRTTAAVIPSSATVVMTGFIGSRRRPACIRTERQIAAPIRARTTSTNHGTMTGLMSGAG